MDLNTIKQYSHRVDKIVITNNNTYSMYDNVMFRVSLDNQYLSDNETIRFSLQPNDEFLPHQRFDNNYYFMIPNSLKKTYTVNEDNIVYVYAHHFPSELYEYEENEEIFSVYDFRELLEEHPKDQYFGEEYEKRITQSDYTWHIDDHGRLVVQSLLNDSVNHFNDPNYKNYIEDDKNNINMTEKGMFPLSSRYRSKQNWTAPDLNESSSIWKEETNERNRNMSPYWEVKINRNGLSPLITNGVENVDWDALPFNVYLNYEYLPTSREYHQHYYGFEPNIDDTECKTINVLEGTNVNSLDDKFGSKNNYRLINYGNPYDDSHSMYVPHGYEIPFSFTNFTFDKQNCIWNKNICYDFWIYQPENNDGLCNGYCQQSLSLVEGDCYTLRFFMYIPSYTQLDDCDSCYVTVIADVDNDFYWEEDDMIQYDHTTMERNGRQAIYKINDAFLQKDKTILDEWIYHEIPFKAGATNTIRIVGPQNTHNLSENPIFFTNMSILKMEEYSPTLKYTNTGLYVTEKDQFVYKPAAEEQCIQGDFAHPDNKEWISSNSIELPRPYSQVQMILDHESYLEYDEKTSNLYFVHDKKERLEIEHYVDDNEDKLIIHCDESYNTKAWYYQHEHNNEVNVTNGADISYIYGDFDDDFFDDENYVNNYEHSPATWDTNLYVSYKDYLILVRGPNNKIKIKVQDIVGNSIDTGTINASIITVVNKETPTGSTSKDLRTMNVNNGLVTWYNVDLTDLEHNDLSNLSSEDVRRLEQEVNTDIGEKYYLRLEYNNPCHNKPYIDFKPFYVVDEEIDMMVTVNDNPCINENNHLVPATGNNDIYIPGHQCCIDEAIDEYGNIINFPIKICAYISDQLGQEKNNGYCELSIDDVVTQTTMVDLDGKADFYLDLEDIHTGCQTIKIEYYREFYQSVVFKYFKLCIDPNIDLRPAIPIDIKVLKNGRTESLLHDYSIDYDDVLLCSISSNYHNEFNLKVEESINNEEYTTVIQKNILNYNESIDFLDMPFEKNNYKTITYRITTGNRRQNDNGDEIEDKYRQYSRTFKVFRTDINS